MAAEKGECGCGLAVARILNTLRESTRSAYADMVTPPIHSHLSDLMSQLQVHISEAEDSCKADLRPVRERASTMKKALDEKNRGRFVIEGMKLRDTLEGSLEECAT